MPHNATPITSPTSATPFLPPPPPLTLSTLSRQAHLWSSPVALASGTPSDLPSRTVNLALQRITASGHVFSKMSNRQLCVRLEHWKSYFYLWLLWKRTD